MTSNNSDLPLDFRQEEVGFVLDRVSAGESCALIGVSSTGKSNFFRFILRQDVQVHYLGDEASQYLFVLLDSNSLSIDGMSTWKIYELALHRLLCRMEQLPIEETAISHFDDLYQRVATTKESLLGQRFLERLVAYLCRQLGYRLVFLFDEFDEIIRDFDHRFFLNLRALRDDFKYRLMYVVASRDELARIREDISEVEAFYELLSINTCGLKPYNHSDAHFMIRRLAERRQVPFDEMQSSHLVEATGGHPGILRAAFWFVTDREPSPQPEPVEALLNNAGVWDECLKIWDSLGQDERQALLVLTSKRRTVDSSPEVIDLLALKGMLKTNANGETAIFSPLFERFIEARRVSTQRGLEIEPEAGQVRIDGRPVTDLTNLEHKLLLYLYGKQGLVCSRDELIIHLYPGEQSYDSAVPDNRIDTVIGRLRDKIEPDRSHPRYVITVRGRGYKLTVDP